MPETTKKEPGRPDVTHRERGDPRQQDHAIDRQRPPAEPKTPDEQPLERRDPDSPWMGGG